MNNPNTFDHMLAPTRQDLYEAQLDIALGDGLTTFGTCDRLVLYPAQRKALLGDYKTGVSQIDHPSKNQQAKAYTLGVFQKYEWVDEVTFVFYIPEYQDAPHHTFLRSDVDDLQAELTAVVAAATEARPLWFQHVAANGQTRWTHAKPECLRASQHCRFCRYEEGCPALTGLVVEVAKRLNPALPEDLSDIENPEDPSTIEFLYNIAKIVEVWAEGFRKRAIAKALQEGVVYPTLQLRSLGAVTSVTDTPALVALAQDQYGLTPEQLFAVASVPLGKLADVIAGQVPKKEKTAVKQEFLATCQDAGIVQRGEPRYTLS